MENYLGEKIVDMHTTKYALYSQSDFAMMWIEKYTGIDGSHHKDWLLDQVTRILKGTKVIIKIAKWGNGYEEERFELDDPSNEYLDWVKEVKNGEDGENTYDYDCGIAP